MQFDFSDFHLQLQACSETQNVSHRIRDRDWETFPSIRQNADKFYEAYNLKNQTQFIEFVLC